MARRTRSFKTASLTEALQAGFRRSRTLMRRPNLVERYMPEVEVVALSVKNSLGNELRWADVLGMATLVEPLWSLIVRSGKELTDEERQDFVVDAFWVIYKTLDGGPSGKGNGIDIPVLFSQFERGKAEETVVPMLVQFALSAVKTARKT